MGRTCQACPETSHHILRPVFDDLVAEEVLPMLGYSTYRADFGIPSLGILIEVKYVRKGSDFKEIEKQVLEDSVAYLNGVTAYKEIVVFIYDDSASVQEHDTPLPPCAASTASATSSSCPGPASSQLRLSPASPRPQQNQGARHDRNGRGSQAES
ncbi:MAG TPA: hypothetical protein VMG38_13390 [Trebonia sp.]|nr:hypothetical protein [Trebonia sp.]